MPNQSLYTIVGTIKYIVAFIYVPNENYKYANKKICDVNSIFQDSIYAFLPTAAALKKCAIIFGHNDNEKIELPTTATYNDRLTLTPTEVYDYALARNQQLKELVIPKNFEHLGSYIVQDCENLEQISCLSSIPPACEPNSFSGVDKFTVTLKIPHGSFEAYSKAVGWKDFFNIEETDFITGIESITQPTNVSIDGYYSIDGHKLSVPQQGVNIIRYSNGQTKKVFIK